MRYSEQELLYFYVDIYTVFLLIKIFILKDTVKYAK